MSQRISLSHDYLLVMRGAERTFLEMASEYEKATLYTLLYEPALVARMFPGRELRASVLQRLRVTQAGFRRLLPLMPIAASNVHIENSDVVIASSSAFAHGFKVTPEARLICYCHSPFRYAWHERHRALLEAPFGTQLALKATLMTIRKWDYASQLRIDHLIANSAITRTRIQDYWNRDAVILHPPVAIDRFVPGEPEGYFLIVCELVRHKRVDIALQAARLANRSVKVVGAGPDAERLRVLYSDVGEFVGRVPDEELAQLYSHADAVIVPNVEEFGIVAVEAQAAGRPVVGANTGGTAETVVDGVTGVLLDLSVAGQLAEVLRQTDFSRFDSKVAVHNAARFSTEQFRKRLRGLVESWTSS
jgi:glycosyltransferase involved in cell wall biosynthesis